MKRLFILSILLIFTSLLKAQNSLNFLSKDITLARSQAKDMLVVDLDNDGDDDIVSSNRYLTISGEYGKLVWFENVDNHYFDQHILNDEIEIYKHIDYGDLDADGDIDLIATSQFYNHLVWV